MGKIDFSDRCRSEWIKLINEWILDERSRYIMIRCNLDGVSAKKAGEEIGLLQRQTERKLSRATEDLAKHI